MIDEFVKDVTLFDRQATIRQILDIRYGKLDDRQALSEQLAEMPSNEMLRLLLTCTPEELAQTLANPTADLSENHHPTDLFTVSGPLEGYYRDKEMERRALELVAQFRFGKVDPKVRSAIKFLLQSPLPMSMKKVYGLTRNELIRATNDQA